MSAAALRCESPKPLLNGRYELSPFNTFGAKLGYTCDDGFMLVGLAERVCQGDGYWSGEAPICRQSESSSAIDYQYESTLHISAYDSYLKKLYIALYTVYFLSLLYCIL